jgi:uncharacterized repeat protein (TIGR01451 family)
MMTNLVKPFKEKPELTINIEPHKFMKLKIYISILAAAGITTVQAQVLTPVPVQQPDMSTLVSGMTELALNATSWPFKPNGATITEYDATGPNGGDLAQQLIDGLINQTPYPWGTEPNYTTNNAWQPGDHISGAPPTPDVAIIDFTGTNNPSLITNSVTLGMIVISGRAVEHGSGTYTFQYTTDPPPIVLGSTWTTIGTYTWANTLPLPRLAFVFPAIQNVTGIQLQSLPDEELNLTNASTGGFQANTIQELETYPPFTNAPTIVTQPQGTNAFVTYNVQLGVAAAGGTSYKWYKDNSPTPISGAISNTLSILNAQVGDSGTYKVVVSNLFGPVTSSNAVVNVSIPSLRVVAEHSAYQFAWTNVPNFTYAVQGSPDGVTYTTISNWTANVGNLVETAVPRPTPYNQFRLTLIAHP